MKLYWLEFPACLGLALYLGLSPAEGNWYLQRGASILPALWIAGRAYTMQEELEREERLEQKRQQETAEQAAAVAQARQLEQSLEEMALQYKQQLDRQAQEQQRRAEVTLRQIAAQLDEKAEELKLREAKLAQQEEHDQEQRTLDRMVRQLKLGRQLGEMDIRANQELERQRIQSELELEAYRQKIAAQLGLSAPAAASPSMRSADPITVNVRPSEPPRSGLVRPAAPAGYEDYIDDVPFDPRWGGDDDSFQEFKVT